MKQSARFLHFITRQSVTASTQGNKKSNCLGKPENYIINPNEYTLYLIPLPLFSVDILESQISANNLPIGRYRHEKYHMIQITSLVNSIWRGEVWSRISFKINPGNFFHSPRKVMTFMLNPEIEDVTTWIIYESDCDKVDLKFTRNTVIGCNRSKSLVAMDTYNSLKADIHKDLVGSRGKSMLVIDAWCEYHSENEETIFESFQTI